MATMGTQSSEAADLLEKLSLDSQTKSLEVPQKKFGSLDSRTGISSMAKPYERSMMPVQDLTNLNMYYSTNGYTSYYPGGFEDPFNLWNEYRYLNYDAADLHPGLQQRRLSSEIGQSGHLGNNYRSGSAYGLNYYNPKSTWNTWQTVDNKYPSKGLNNGFFSYGNENKDSLNELSKGPRGKDVKNQLGFGYVKLAVKGQDLTQKANSKEETLSIMPDKQQYNKEDFSETYSDAKFFVIKSYSEDDVHKSIKYNVWASTPTGNQKLDAAYQESKGKTDACPVFLLFSVNASGQFVGLAEMVGPVDFNKNMDFWQQDKWTGCFPVKWHIVKDVPNSLLKHITLENNDNKPVTNSRDTQEVKLEQAVQVVKIFKTHLNKTSILDDFEFYETRQKALQEKKAKRLHYQKQVKNENSGHVDSATAFTDASAAAPNSQSNTLQGSVADISKGEKNGATDEV